MAHLRDNIETHINNTYQKILGMLSIDGQIAPEREKLLQEWKPKVEKHFSSIYQIGIKIQKSKNLDDLFNKLNLADIILEDVIIDLSETERKIELQIASVKKQLLENDIAQLKECKEKCKIEGEKVVSHSLKNLDKLKELSSNQKYHNNSYRIALLMYLIQISDKLYDHLPQIADIAQEDKYMNSLITTLKQSLQSYPQIPAHYEILNEFQNNKATTIKTIFTNNAQVCI
jgi:hypothetical protein